MKSNPYWNNICVIAERQREKGVKTYGSGIEDNLADIITRIESLQEELVDGLMYCEWIKDHIHKKRASEVVHGRWMEFNIMMTCSVCDKDWYYDDNNCDEFNYCPNCGADMRERKGDGLQG